MQWVSDEYQKCDFWIRENLNYARPHFRLEKSARIVNAIAKGRNCDLLDVGCGPATLMRLLHNNIQYYGIDIAIHSPASNLLQADFIENPIRFGKKQFDIIVAQGVFEYVGRYQSQKLFEIAQLLKDRGTFIASYVNFDHVHRYLYAPYNNIRSFGDFRRSLEQFFIVHRYFPTSHHWRHHEPNGRLAKGIQMYVNVNFPLISRLFAIEFFFICGLKEGQRYTSYRGSSHVRES